MPVTAVFRPAFAFHEVPPIRPDGTEARQQAAIDRWLDLFQVAPEAVSRTTERLRYEDPEEEDFSLLRRGAPRVIQVPVDHEDWHENAAKLFAAIDAGLPVIAMTRESKLSVGAYLNGATEASAKDKLIVIGTLINDDPLLDNHVEKGAFFRIDQVSRQNSPLDGRLAVWPDCAVSDKANQYHRLPHWERLANRPCRLADISGEYRAGDPVRSSDPTEAANVIMALHKEGVRRFAVKLMAQAKHSPIVYFDLPDDATREMASSALSAELGFTLVEFEGVRGALLIQERVEMLSEYRIAVVNGVPCAGAGCIEKHTPINSEPGGCFDDKVEGRRGDGRIRKDPGLVSRFYNRACEVALTLRNDGVTHCTIDMAVTPDDRIVLVEINPMMNFGLYAMDLSLWMDLVEDVAVVTPEPDPKPRPEPVVLGEAKPMAAIAPGLPRIDPAAAHRPVLDMLDGVTPDVDFEENELPAP